MNLTSAVSTSSSSVNHPIASKSPGILKASSGKPDARARRNSKPDEASCSQGRLKDAYFSRVNGCSSGETCRDREKSGIVECTESEPWSNHEKEVTGKLVASRNSENSLNSKAGSRKLASVAIPLTVLLCAGVVSTTLALG